MKKKSGIHVVDDGLIVDEWRKQLQQPNPLFLLEYE